MVHLVVQIPEVVLIQQTEKRCRSCHMSNFASTPKSFFFLNALLADKLAVTVLGLIIHTGANPLWQKLVTLSATMTFIQNICISGENNLGYRAEKIHYCTIVPCLANDNNEFFLNIGRNKQNSQTPNFWEFFSSVVSPSYDCRMRRTPWSLLQNA